MANKRGKEVLELLQEKMSGVFCSLSWLTRKVNTSQSLDSPLRILINFVVTSIMIISSCILNVPSVSSGRIFPPAFFKFPSRSKATRRRTTAHTTNSSSSTATVSALPWHLPGLCSQVGSGCPCCGFQNTPKFPCMRPLQGRDGPGVYTGLGNRITWGAEGV